MTRRREKGRGIACGARGPWVALMVALLGVQGCQAETSYDVFVTETVVLTVPYHVVKSQQRLVRL